MKKLISSMTILILCASTIPLVSSQPNGRKNFTTNAKEKARLGTFAFARYMELKPEKDTERERKKADSVFKIAQKICPLRQSWGESVPSSFELNFL